MAQGVPGRLRPRIILTFRHYKGGRSSAKRTGRLYPKRNPWYSLSEAESTSGHMVLSGVPRKNIPSYTTGIDPGTVRLVAQCLNHYVTPDLTNRSTFKKSGLGKTLTVHAYGFTWRRKRVSWKLHWIQIKKKMVEECEINPSFSLYKTV